jgi:hypothetical protein
VTWPFSVSAEETHEQNSRVDADHDRKFTGLTIRQMADTHPGFTRWLGGQGASFAGMSETKDQSSGTEDAMTTRATIDGYFKNLEAKAEWK